ncbi:DUF1993 family protein [Psychromonas aquimarina]|uniref:DUF1993 family protein n=1 Tax=Psychromonas aquimarina TaxID=444919 RepID=UPI0003F78CEE|nr:DUF1993 family protein [Psychromonas aquimarina]
MLLGGELVREVVSFFEDHTGKEAVKKQLTETVKYLNEMPDVKEFGDEKLIKDKAGTSDVELCQSQYIYQYILPNFLFHISMVYAIAKTNGVALSKGDYDGIHSYPSGFSLVKQL